MHPIVFVLAAVVLVGFYAWVGLKLFLLGAVASVALFLIRNRGYMQGQWTKPESILELVVIGMIWPLSLIFYIGLGIGHLAMDLVFGERPTKR